ncbi:GspE/PulE family protein [Aromatoleum evansii]|uniref:GspE/PulE family protein n=1 Tax=Aromatoleum evansii TaxID=59406 RepID=UPI00145EA099|nr:ATPase, T2SS/T4P/T4SS family [Aromatoleum evansii]NMG28354.1 secretion system protein E [Aromatoleum evansii]
MSGFFDALRRQIAPSTGVGETSAPAKRAIGSRVTPPTHGRTASGQVNEIVLANGPVTARVGSHGARLDSDAPSRVDTHGVNKVLSMESAPDDHSSASTATSTGSTGSPLAIRQHNPLRDSDVDLEVNVDLSRVEILSLSGVFEANSEQRKLVCLLSDGRLLVAAGKERYSAHVLSYIALLERHGQRYNPVQTRPANIASLYEQVGGNSSHANKSTLNTKAKATAHQIIADASAARASDIHLEKLHDHATLKFRVDGELESVTEYQPDVGMALIRTFYQVLADIGADTFKENMRLDARIGRGQHLPPGLDGIRIATTPTAAGSKMVMRLLYSMVDDSFDLGELGMARAHTESFDALKDLPIGLNIISGPTGSGKSTTLQRTLRGFIDQTQGTKHVITVEDPPEYPIPGAVQTPVANAHTQAQRAEVFTAAIGSAMRLDPDVIMIGEVRDLPSADLALRAATTGHQVWTTLHANNALNIIDRLINMGMDKDMLLDHTVLTGLVSQRLIRKLCPKCKAPLHDKVGQYDPRQVAQLKHTFGSSFGDLFVTGSGCECCRGGTAGRTVVAEVIRPTAELCALLQAGKRVEARGHWLKEMGGESFMQHAIHKIREGIVDPFAAWKMLGPIVADSDAYAPLTTKA